jgi:DNA-binding phage protein
LVVGQGNIRKYVLVHQIDGFRFLFHKSCYSSIMDIAQELHETIARNLRMVCARDKITLRALSEMTGLSVANLSRIMSAKGNPSISTLAQIATALGTTVGEVLDGTK